jgi:hypothetical protein
MASSPDALLKLELMADGENASSWGSKTNTNLSLIAEAIAKKTSISLGSSNVTLSDTQYASNQSRSLALDLSGTLSANCDILIPARSKLYVVRNATSGAFAVRVGVTAGTFATIPQNSTAIVWCDGAATVLVASNSTSGLDATTLAGVAAALYARLDVSQNWTKGQAVNFSTLADGATVTMDCTLSNNFIVTLGGARTLAITSPKDGQIVDLLIVQDGTGSRTLALPANVHFEGGSAPTLSTAAGAVDMLIMVYHSASGTWKAVFYRAFSATSSSSQTITISSNESYVDVFARAGQPGGAVTVNVVVNTGVKVISDTPGIPAMDFSGFASGSTITLTNFGYIMGAGGRGSSGNWSHDSGDSDSAMGGSDAEPGGDAVRGPGTGRTFNVINASGFIWGGGGGGGGGGVSTNDGGVAASAGGGGGAGGGRGGEGINGKRRGNVDAIKSTNGANGTRVISGTANGAAGSGSTGGSGFAGASGAGGDWGSAGADGTAETTGTSMQNARTLGGAAGKAIDLNGGSTSSFTGSGSPNIKGAVS